MSYFYAMVVNAGAVSLVPLGEFVDRDAVRAAQIEPDDTVVLVSREEADRVLAQVKSSPGDSYILSIEVSLRGKDGMFRTGNWAVVEHDPAQHHRASMELSRLFEQAMFRSLNREQMLELFTVPRPH